MIMLPAGLLIVSNLKLKVHIVGTNGLPANYGGFETLTENLCRELNKNCDFTVYCSANDQEIKKDYHLGAKLVHVPLKANGWQSIPYDCISLVMAVFRSDVILMLGSSGGFVMPFIRLLGKKVIVNVGGVDWKRDKWGPITKRIIRCCEYLTIRNASYLVVDNQYIKNLYLEEYSEDSELIAYGGDHAKKISASDSLLKEYPFLTNKYCLSVSRAQKDNNIHTLLHAFENINDINLVVISNWNSSKYGRELYAEYARLSKNIILIDAIYDQEILDVIRSNAHLYIHTHSACGTAPSLVEAMCLNLPVFCFDCEANRFSTVEFSKYFSNPEELESLVNDYFYSPTLLDISKNLTSVANEKYTWSQVAKSYLRLFKK
ncbi:DUF1972 domain-containing protein [Gammaproteobacteria bacterium]|nr:DUF1972 domain-containing protein [Gammaproteobacteria bacterium]